MKMLSVPAFLVLITVFTPASLAADDMVTLRDNIVGQLTAADPATPAEDAVKLLQPDGSFSDIDYTPNPITYLAFKHIGRLHEMALAWGRPTSARYQDAALKSAIISAYNYWVAHDIQHRNWWFNEIGVPDSLSETMLILQKHDALPADNFAKAIAIIDRALPRQNKLSAANLVWTAYATRNEGVLDYFDAAATDSEKEAASALVKQSFERIDSTIKFTNSDGINVDYGFHAHGPVPFNGGYGVAWLDDTSRIAASAAGTGYGLGHDKVKLMIDYVLGGDQFMSRGINYDVVTTGRGWSRSRPSTAAGLHTSVGYLMKTEPDYRAAEMQALKTRLDHAFTKNTADPADTAVGNRAYYTADYMVQQRHDYLFSVKTLSKRTGPPESINGENLKGGYGYSGLNLLYRTGNEFNEIEAIWDWYRLPGTTSERPAGDATTQYNLKPASKRSPKTIAGGASDGMVGAHAYQFSQYNITANKSWFLFDRGEVAMGNSITQEKPMVAGDSVGTNINQTLSNGDVIYSTAAGHSTTLAAGQSITPKGLRWVNHDSVGYFFLDPTDNATIRNETRTGAWHAINLVADPAEKITNKVFDLDLDHGRTPADASYVYAVIPGIAAADMDAFLAAKPFTVLRNDAVAQAVVDNANGITEINFYAPGDVEQRPGVKIALANPPQSASVILRHDSGKVTISVASPEHRAGPLTLRLTGHYTADKAGDQSGASAEWDATNGRTTLTFRLPDGPTAGSTVTESFTAVP
jgi:chondroitin AC lyase